jgi:heme-degrading monooxygenase HmoA
MEAMGGWTFVKRGCTAAAHGLTWMSRAGADLIRIGCAGFRSSHFVSSPNKFKRNLQQKYVHVTRWPTAEQTRTRAQNAWFRNVQREREREREKHYFHKSTDMKYEWMKVLLVFYWYFLSPLIFTRGYTIFRLHDPTFRTVLIKTFFKLFPLYEIIESLFCA